MRNICRPQCKKEKPILQIGTDKIILGHVGFLERNEWEGEFKPARNGGLVWYTDSSKANKGTMARVYVMV
jgi:hypothetical protein